MGRFAAVLVFAAAMAACRPDPEPARTETPDPTSDPTPSTYEELRAAEDRALLASLAGDVELGPYRIRSAHDLGTTRMVTLDRPEHPQTVSIIDMVPPDGLTADAMRAALAGGASEPLEVLGYDRVSVRDGILSWTRAPDESGQGTVRWTECGDRWIFVSEEIVGGTIEQEVNADLLRSFQICVR